MIDLRLPPGPPAPQTRSLPFLPCLSPALPSPRTQSGTVSDGRRAGPLGATQLVGVVSPAQAMCCYKNKYLTRARIYFFVFVVHTMNTMAGAMQFSRGYSRHPLSCLLAFSPSIKS